ncbi:MAG: hypothetical protein F6K21_27645, partial [Symploca sp. SIO2D2]|nr:hypothetical protein [Symploca sp. SIO2D2]
GVLAVFLSVTNEAGTSMAQPLTIKIEPGLEAPVVVSALRAAGTVGENFVFEILATNMPEQRPLPPSAKLDAQDLPSGLGVNTSTGIISGTPEEAGLFIVSLTATNEAGEGNPKLIVIKIEAALDAPEITSGSEAAAQVGKTFSFQVTATNTPTSYDADHSVAWLSIDTAAGTLTGTPTEPGTFYVGLTAANESGTSDESGLEITVYPAPETPKITSTRETTGKIGVDFEYQILASNTPTSYAVSGLPAGLTLDSETGLISGSPTASGTFDVVMVASNENGEGEEATLTMTISPRTEIRIVIGE